MACTLPRPPPWQALGRGGIERTRTCRRPRRERGRQPPCAWSASWRRPPVAACSGASGGPSASATSAAPSRAIPTSPSWLPTASPAGSTATWPAMLIGGVERPPAPDPAPAGHGRRGRPLRLPRGPARAPPPDRAVRRHHDLRHDGAGGGRGGPGAPGAPPGQGHRTRRPPVLGGRSRAGDLHPRGRDLELPGLLAALRFPDPRPRASATSTTRRWRPSPSTSARSGRRARSTRPRATSCACGPALRRARRPAQARDWLVARRGRQPERARRVLVGGGGGRRRCCRAGPAASSASPWPRPVDFAASTPSPSRR